MAWTFCIEYKAGNRTLVLRDRPLWRTAAESVALTATRVPGIYRPANWLIGRLDNDPDRGTLARVPLSPTQMAELAVTIPDLLP